MGNKELKEMYEGESYDGRELLSWGGWTRLEGCTEVQDNYLLHGWKEGKVTGSRKLSGLQAKVAQKRSENNMIKYRNELLMQMLTCAQMDLERYETELEFAKGRVQMEMGPAFHGVGPGGA